VTQAAAQAAQFFAEVARTGTVWMIRGSSGLPTVQTPEGHAVPFWSSRKRAEAIVAAIPAYRRFEPVALTWANSRDQWLPDITRESLRIGVNWTGVRAIGYDFDAATVRPRVEAHEPAQTEALPATD